ncbi:unnamed protein product [Citrullus colocynthis]|uniref:Uncharacterized protein n=1 Tax=Citrullus colocynthis TaxID=252529 RepID=A0ABP0YJE9_9ROSI
MICKGHWNRILPRNLLLLDCFTVNNIIPSFLHFFFLSSIQRGGPFLRCECVQEHVIVSLLLSHVDFPAPSLVGSIPRKHDVKLICMTILPKRRRTPLCVTEQKAVVSSSMRDPTQIHESLLLYLPTLFSSFLNLLES